MESASSEPNSRYATLTAVIDHLRTRALYTAGVFRVTTNMTEVRTLLRRCDEGYTACLAECDDNHLVAGLLLEVLKELPESLLGFEDVLGLAQPSNFTDVGRLVCSYSSERCNTIQAVVSLLRAFHLNAPANGSNVSHLVSIFSPVLCRPPSGAFMSIRHIKALPHIQPALTTLIQYYDLVFRRARAWSQTSDVESHQSQVVVIAITEELLNRAVSTWLDVEPMAPTILPEPSQRWAETRDSTTPKLEPPPRGRGAGSGEVDDPTLSVSDDEEVVVVENLRDLDTSAGGKKVTRKAAAGLSVNVPTGNAPMVGAPVSPPTPWVASPGQAAAAAATGSTRTSEAPKARRPSGALRRQQVAEYRKVRVQVKRFEEAYKVTHGSLPRGKARAPLKEVYARYRKLKQLVRDGSALHIQTVYRGHAVRRKIHGPGAGAGRGPAGSEPAAAGAGRMLDREVFDAKRDTSAGATSAADSIPTLKADKSNLKRQLKQFDIDFKAKHGRMPSSEDKEPIRHLYRRYHDIKEALAELEAESTEGTTSSDHNEYRSLRREKRMLQLKLKTYEDEFQRLTGRKVRYHKDIRPVEAEYQRYKEVKARIGQLSAAGSP